MSLITRRRIGILLAIAASGCAPRACSEGDERTLSHAVEVLVGEPGARADAAERLLVDAGRDAVLYLETGLYDAEPRARRRIVRTLVRIGDPIAAPILRHLAARDPDEDVRSAASEALGALESARPP